MTMDLNSQRANKSHPSSGERKGLRFFRDAAIILAVIAFLLVLIEGLAGYAYVARRISSYRNIWVQGNVGFGSDLGWSNIPNVYLPNLFGPGVYFAPIRKASGMGGIFPRKFRPGNSGSYAPVIRSRWDLV